MGVLIEDQVLVHLVGHRDHVVLDAQTGDDVELLSAEHLAGGVVWRVEQQHPGAGAEGGSQLVGIEGVGGRPQLHQAVRGAGHRDVGRVDVEVGLEGHHLVAGPGQGQDRRGDGLGGARGDQNLGVGVELQAPEPLLVVGHSLTQHRVADAGRVLVELAANGLDGGLGHRSRPVGVGKALAQVDGTGADRQGRHLREHRCPAEGLQAVAQIGQALDGHRHRLRLRPRATTAAAASASVGRGSRPQPEPGATKSSRNSQASSLSSPATRATTLPSAVTPTV